MKKFFALATTLVVLITSLLAFPISASAASNLGIRCPNWVSANTSFSISWNSIDSAKKYQVSIYDATIGKQLVSKKTTSTNFTLTGSKVGASRRLEITISALDRWGGTITTQSATVKSEASRPSVSTKTISLGFGGHLSMTGSVDLNGGAPVTDCGFVINGIQYSHGYMGSTKGRFSVNVTLPAGSYSCKAYACNAYGTSYSEVKSIRVYQCPWCGSSVRGSFWDIYGHTLQVGCFKQNTTLALLWDSGSELLSQGIQSAIGGI